VSRYEGKYVVHINHERATRSKEVTQKVSRKCAIIKYKNLNTETAKTDIQLQSQSTVLLLLRYTIHQQFSLSP